MKLTITFEQDINEDGVEGVVSLTREDVSTVEDILNAFHTAFNMASFQYVKACGAALDDNKEVWSDW